MYEAVLKVVVAVLLLLLIGNRSVKPILGIRIIRNSMKKLNTDILLKKIRLLRKKD